MKTATAPLPPLRSVKVLDQLRERIRYLHYSLPTEQAYVHWVRAFIRFTVRHPATLGSSEVEAFLSWLANERKVSVSTHRQALAALLFFYGKVLHGSALASGDRKTSAVAALAGGADLRMKWFASSVFWKASIVCSPSFCMERACGSVRFATAGQGSDFRSRHDHRAEGKRSGDRALMLPESFFGTQPARAAVACTGMVAEGPGRRAAAALRFPTP